MIISLLPGVLIAILAVIVVIVVWRRQQQRPKRSDSNPLIPYVSYQGERTEDGRHARIHHEMLSVQQQKNRSRALYKFMNMRRSIRFFSTRSVDAEVLENCVLTAGTAPSGAHQQPWVFVAVRNPQLKREIRAIVEENEKLNYERRMKAEWVQDVEGLVSHLHDGGVMKPYLTDAPVLMLVFKKTYDIDPVDASRRRTIYYPMHGVGIATGLFIAALHNANLVTLTSTPLGSEARIQKLLDRPRNEKLFLLMPIGYPSADATVPYRDENTYRKPVKHIYAVYE